LGKAAFYLILTLRKTGSDELFGQHRAIAWFVDHQEADGLWPIGYGEGRKVPEVRRWVGLAVCAVLRRFYG